MEYRFGTCGSLDKSAQVGSVMITDSACLISRNVEAFIAKRTSLDHIDRESWKRYYDVSSPEYPSSELKNSLKAVLEGHGQAYSEAKNATSDSFYSSQGRLSANFMDVNQDLLPHLATEPYNIRTMDMETFYLFHLSNIAHDHDSGMIHTADIKFVVANRMTDEFLVDSQKIETLESTIGEYCLETLSKFSLA